MRKKTKKQIENIRQYYMIESIRNKRIDNLSIGWDAFTFDPTPDEGKPVFLFTPDMENTKEHFHISLETKEAVKLRDWLNRFLDLKGL